MGPRARELRHLELRHCASALLGVTRRFVQNCTLSRKVFCIRLVSQTFVCAWVSFRRRILEVSLSKPSFRTDPKGNRDLKGCLACSFGQIVRRPQLRRECEREGQAARSDLILGN